MRRYRLGLGIIAFLGACLVAGGASASDKLADKGKIDQVPALSVEFGDDASAYANDGECDDGRFSGPGSAKRPAAVDRGHDATDCAAALAAGTVTFNGEPIRPLIDYGDDNSSYANNGECDDPRFQGSTGMASVLISSDVLHDATDCRALVEAGSITVIPVYTPSYAEGAPYDASGVTFGNDVSSYANNGVCDDPRFFGPGTASTLLEEDLLHDATDCEAAYVAGTVVLKADAEANPDIDFNVYTSDKDVSIDFGTNTGDYINNGECDDPRFEGPGAASILLHSDRMKDARDCRDLFDAGEVSLLAVYGVDYVDGAPYDAGDIDFGDNSSDYADNEQCDDPRFIGPGTADILLDDDELRDSADCNAAFVAGTIVLRAGAEGRPTVDTTVYTSTLDPSIDFGDNTSSYKNNEQCDDPRFAGEGMASVLIDADKLHDAKDCSALFDAGRIILLPVFAAGYADGAPYDSSGIDFGDDSSNYANNSECDDPRFAGPGRASIVLDEDTLKDATDCRGAFEAGLVMLQEAVELTAQPATEPEPSPEAEPIAAPEPTVAPEPSSVPANAANAAIDFGDDASPYALDGECDDPRFEGTGMAAQMATSDTLHDATDCRTLVENGSIGFLAVFAEGFADGAPFDTAGIDFGDDSSNYANNSECDDPRFVGPGSAAVLSDDDLLKDATDCRDLFVTGRVVVREGAALLTSDVAAPDPTPGPGPSTIPGTTATPAVDLSAIDFGDDTSDYAQNGECDDHRFAGTGMATILVGSDVGHDAADCRTLAEAGQIAIQPVFTPGYADGAPYDAAGIDFGDNSSQYKDNGECDDPRFAGPGMALVTVEADALRDAADCEAKFVAGEVALKG